MVELRKALLVLTESHYPWHTKNLDAENSKSYCEMSSLTLLNVCGISSNFDLHGACPFAVHPDGSYVYAAGRSIIIHNRESGEQRILPGHTAAVTSVAISPDGCFIASGQHAEGNGRSAVCIWNYESGEASVYSAFPAGVRCIAFSPNSRFVTACSIEGGGVAVWDIVEKILVGKYNARDGRANTFASWAPLAAEEASRTRPTMTFITGDHNRIFYCSVVFDRAGLVYTLSTSYIDLPPSGTVRDFTAGLLVGDFALLGTPAGEMSVLNVKTGIFRTMIKYFRSAVTGIVSLTNGYNTHAVALSSQDGDMLTLYGLDNTFTVVSEVSLNTPLTCLLFSQATGCIFVICGYGSVFSYAALTCGLRNITTKQTDNVYLNKYGNVGELPGQRDYNSIGPASRRNVATHSDEPGEPAEAVGVRLDTEHPTLVLSFPAYPLVYAGFLADPASSGATQLLIGSTMHGTAHLWEFTNVSSARTSLVVTLQVTPPNVFCTALATFGNLAYMGFSDGSIICLSYDGRSLLKVFDIPSAHKKDVTSLAASKDYMFSGGVDGQLFAWSTTSGALLGKVTEHSSRVYCIIADLVVPTIIHASFRDGYIASHDFKAMAAPRKLKHRNMFGMAAGAAQLIRQVPCGRYEVAAACVDGVIRFYDFDVQDPVQEVALPEGVCANKKGRYVFDLTGQSIVTAGCECEGDEVIMTLINAGSEWAPNETHLCNGAEICTVNFDATGRRVVMTGSAGEIFVYSLE